MKIKNIFLLIITVIVIASVSFVLILLASGYRFDLENGTIQGTGIISVTSFPDGGLVYVNGVPKDATNTSITELKPGTYSLEIEKEGFSHWQKDIDVAKELVTKVEALLLPLYPTLRPLTFTGVTKPHLSPDQQKVVYSVENNNLSGLWLLSFDELPFNIARKPRLLVADTDDQHFSTSEITWSPDSTTILLKNEDYLGTFDITSNSLVELEEAETITSNWSEQQLLSDREKIANLPLTERETINTFENIQWSPDEKYILHSKTVDNAIEYQIYVMPNTVEMIEELPTPLEVMRVGDNPIAVIDSNQKHQVQWFPDSTHLIISTVENGITTVEIVEIDGHNKTQIFSGNINEIQIFPNPNGTKVIALTTFNSDNKTFNLYSINLR